MTNLLTNGIGGTVGDTLATCKPLYTKSTVWYVSSVIGSDVNSIGIDRERPFATLALAFATAAANDIIVLLSGHSETLTATQTINKAITIVGEGTIAGKPGVSFQMNTAGNLSLFSVTAANVHIGNVYFKTNLQTNSSPVVAVTGTDSRFIGCYWELSGKEVASSGLSLGATSDRALIKNCTFISIATATSSVPLNGLVSTSGSLADIEIQGAIFDGGTVDFGAAALQLNTTTRLRADGISLLHGADAIINASSTGWFNPQTVTGGSTVSW